MDKISVILPIYNVGNVLLRCLNSIVSQSYQNLEIILVNDGSTDNSFAICQDAMNQDPRIHVINQQNSGRGVARNRGMAASTGDFISFIDPDDYVDIDFFTHLHQQIEKYDSDIAVCGYKILKNKKLYPQVYDGQETVVGVYSGNEWLMRWGDLFYKIWLSLTGPCAKLIQRKCMEGVYFPEDRKYAEDTKTMWQFYLNAAKISYQQDADYIYDQPTNSYKKTALQQLELVNALEEQITFLASTGLNMSSTIYVYHAVLQKACNYAKATGNANLFKRLSFKLKHFNK